MVTRSLVWLLMEEHGLWPVIAMLTWRKHKIQCKTFISVSRRLWPSQILESSALGGSGETLESSCDPGDSASVWKCCLQKAEGGAVGVTLEKRIGGNRRAGCHNTELRPRRQLACEKGKEGSSSGHVCVGSSKLFWNSICEETMKSSDEEMNTQLWDRQRAKQMKVLRPEGQRQKCRHGANMKELHYQSQKAVIKIHFASFSGKKNKQVWIYRWIDKYFVELKKKLAMTEGKQKRRSSF